MTTGICSVYLPGVPCFSDNVTAKGMGWEWWDYFIVSLAGGYDLEWYASYDYMLQPSGFCWICTWSAQEMLSYFNFYRKYYALKTQDLVFVIWFICSDKRKPRYIHSKCMDTVATFKGMRKMGARAVGTQLLYHIMGHIRAFIACTCTHGPAALQRQAQWKAVSESKIW